MATATGGSGLTQVPPRGKTVFSLQSPLRPWRAVFSRTFLPAQATSRGTASTKRKRSGSEASRTQASAGRGVVPGAAFGSGALLLKLLIDGLASQPVEHDTAEELRVCFLDLLRPGRQLSRQPHVQLDGAGLPMGRFRQCRGGLGVCVG